MLEKARKLQRSGCFLEADQVYQALQAQYADDPQFLLEWAIVKRRLETSDLALTLLEKALALVPDDAEVACEKGRVLRDQGRRLEAIDVFVAAINADRRLLSAYVELGMLLKDMHNYPEAEKAFTYALRLQKDDAGLWSNLGTTFHHQGKWREAELAYRKALGIDPDMWQVWNNFGCFLRQIGKIDDSIDAFEQALSFKPEDDRIHSNLLLTMHASDRLSPDEIFRAHLRWGEIKQEVQTNHFLKISNGSVKIGYLSPDFNQHPVATFIHQVLRLHDRNRFKVCCFSLSQYEDDMTDILRNSADAWFDVSAYSDDEVRSLVREQEIDILVDLAGHTGKNRLSILASRIAPVQVSFLGYCDTTGLKTVDYRITDAWADPVGITDCWHTERLVRLPRSYLGYRPPYPLPAVSPLPAEKAGYLTFGSFNDVSKVSPKVLTLWAEVLRSVPDSVLLLRSRAVSDAGVFSRVGDALTGLGVAPERIQFGQRKQKMLDHLAEYNRIDIALDTFPYNGVTTTCESLVMGVPVITRAGETNVSRCGVSLLNAVGHPEWIAISDQEYVNIAVNLAADRQALSELRRGLREQVFTSELGDIQSLTDALEAAYETFLQYAAE